MTDHTPGPWTYKTFDDGTRRIVHGHISIAQTFGSNEETNARLIAAAPDMYDELVALWTILKQHQDIDREFDLRRIREILNEAEGRHQ